MNDDRRHGQRAGISPARIEAAARALDPTAFEHLDGHTDAECHDCKGRRDELRDDATRALEAAFPELVPEIFDGLPHAWIAPFELTQTMAFACGTVTPSEAGRVWREMRDAHLSRKQSE